MDRMAATKTMRCSRAVLPGHQQQRGTPGQASATRATASASTRERGTEAIPACRVTGQRLHVREHW